MKIFLNGQAIITEKTSLKELLTQQNYLQDWLAIAVNEKIVSASERQDFLLKEQDRIEVLAPMQGG